MILKKLEREFREHGQGNFFITLCLFLVVSLCASFAVGLILGYSSGLGLCVDTGFKILDKLNIDINKIIPSFIQPGTNIEKFFLARRYVSESNNPLNVHYEG